ncbi:hypothetical protein [Thiolapillus sp.]
MKTAFLQSGLLCWVCGMGVSTVHAAGAWDYFGFYQLGYSDNLELAPDGGTSGFYNTLGAGIGYEEHGTRLDGNVDASVEYVNYPSNVFDDEIWLYIDGDLRWALVRDRLFWVFTDSLTNQPIDARVPNVPANLQQTNVFTTGPSLSYQFDAANRMQADLRYLNSWAEEDDAFIADRWFAGASWIYGLTAADDLSFHMTYYDTDFKHNDTQEDYQRQSVFAAWERRTGETSTLRAELGMINVDFDESDNVDGPRVVLEWNHIISSSSSLRVNGRHGLTDAALSIVTAVDPETIGTSVISGDVYEVTALDVSYNFSWSASMIDLALGYEQQDYVTDGQIDRDMLIASAGWTRTFGGGWSGRVNGSVDWSDYDDGLEDKSYLLYAGVDYASTRHMSYQMGVNWERRDSTSADAEYEDWGFVLMVRYDR